MSSLVSSKQQDMKGSPSSYPKCLRDGISIDQAVVSDPIRTRRWKIYPPFTTEGRRSGDRITWTGQRGSPSTAGSPVSARLTFVREVTMATAVMARPSNQSQVTFPACADWPVCWTHRNTSGRRELIQEEKKKTLFCALMKFLSG